MSEEFKQFLVFIFCVSMILNITFIATTFKYGSKLSVYIEICEAVDCFGKLKENNK